MTVWHFGAQSDLASERLVLETAHFVVSAPFACREPWRLYLAPKRHSPDARPATYDADGCVSIPLLCFHIV